MTTSYDMREAVDGVLADFQGVLHTAFPARVLAYNATAQTVDVRPAIKREGTADDGGYAYDALPDLFGVQVMWPRAGGFAITFPVAVGDWVKVTCAEQSTLAWRNSGVAPSSPGISDPHGLNGLVAEVGWHPDRTKLANVNTSALEIRSDDGATTITVSGSVVTLGSDAGAQYVALANLVDAHFARLQAAFDTHVHAAVTGLGTPTPPVVVPGAIPVATLATTAATKVKAK